MAAKPDAQIFVKWLGVGKAKCVVNTSKYVFAAAFYTFTLTGIA